MGEEVAVFGGAAGDAFAPHAEGGGLEGGAHEGDDVFFGVAGFFENFLEGGAVFPGHADDAVFELFVHARGGLGVAGAGAGENGRLISGGVGVF